MPKKIAVLKPNLIPEYYENLISVLSGLDAEIIYDTYEADLLILPNAAHIHADASALNNYLQNGGRILTLGGPLPGNHDLSIEGLTPHHKFYPIDNGAKASTFDNQVFVSSSEYKLGSDLFSVHPRPQGTGYGKNRVFRFVPLIEVFNDKGFRSGFLAWMYINPSGSIVAGFGANSTEFYDDAGLAAVLDTARTMLLDCLLLEGGTDEYIYAENETIKTGALLNCKQPKDFAIDIALTPTEKPTNVTVTLKQNGKTVDKISHAIEYRSPKPLAERKYITINNGEFIRGGEIVRFFGVNYMPTSGIGVNPEHTARILFHYLGRTAYDPDVIYKDLVQVKDVGFNAISVFIDDISIVGNNLLHLVQTCKKMGIYVDLALRFIADPMDFNKQRVTEAFHRLHLAELDNIIAHDIAWERDMGSYEGSFGNPKGRKAYDAEWAKWVINNYGSIDNAEQEWGYPMPMGNYLPAGVTGEMLQENGNHSKIVAAYRRFADDFISLKYSQACEFFRQLDPHHLISMRSGAFAGVPLINPSTMGYDFKALAAGLDFLSPESYMICRMSAYDEGPVKQGIFTNLYARYAKPNAPVVWKECGWATWGEEGYYWYCGPTCEFSNFDKTSKSEKNQADVFEELLDMMIAGDARGVYWWFWAGGYRTDEKSDFGVINPDGSDRLATPILREYSQKFLNKTVLPKANHFIEVDRDAHADSIRGIYNAVQAEMFEAMAEGKTVAFVDKSTNSDTASVPDTAVGGGTAGEHNPARYVNGEIVSVSILLDGKWQPVENNGIVTLPKEQPLKLKVTMCNTLGSTWRNVSLWSTGGSDIKFDLPVSKDLQHLDIHTQEFELPEKVYDYNNVSFRFKIKNRFPFGNGFCFGIV